ncbi:MAG TPA: O-antigen ligase family protein [Candidatus Limnocylindrales bacterium]
MAPVEDVAGAGESGAAAGHMGDEAPGVIDLYRSVLYGVRSTLDAARRRRLAIAVEVSIVVLYVLLRTADAGRPVLILWSLLAMAIAVVSPISGLVILAAIAPFSEPFTITRQLGLKPFLVVAVGAGTAVRIASAIVIGQRSRPSVAAWRSRVGDRGRLFATLAIAAACVILLGTALGVVHTRLAFGRAAGMLAGETWLAGIGAGMIILVVGAWAGMSGTVRPVAAAVVSALVGGAVSVADYFDAGAVRGQSFAWLVRPGRFEGRLTGIIPSPNGVGALLIAPAAVLIAVAVLGRGLRLRVAAAVAVIPFAIALYVTYSRAALIGLFLIAVVVVWRLRRAVGIGLLVVGLAGGILLLPRYLQVRSEALGGAGGAEVRPGDLLVASDAFRLRAWGAAGQMWLNAPLTGQGFMAYFYLHDAYGDPILRAPHNEWIRLFAEDGLFIGLAGAAFVCFTAAALSSGRGALGAGALGGFLGFAVAASFNNPFGFVQVMVIACTITGIGLGRVLAARRAHGPPATGAEGPRAGVPAEERSAPAPSPG